MAAKVPKIGPIFNWLVLHCRLSDLECVFSFGQIFTAAENCHL